MQRHRWHPIPPWAAQAMAGAVLLGVGCGGGEAPESSPEQAGELVTPPFDVRGDARGLLLTWYDEQGPHTATSRHEIPEARRGEVRVDSLEIPPERRDPDHVYVADLRAPDERGRYVVRRLSRAAFDARIERFGATPEGDGEGAAGEGPAGEGPAGEGAASDVVIFGASWCGACRQAEAFLRARGVPFVERDIERDPGARADMQRRAQAAGIRPTGIPVIDVRGRVLQGFDPEALERALRETSRARGSGGVSI